MDAKIFLDGSPPQQLSSPHVHLIPVSSLLIGEEGRAFVPLFLLLSIACDFACDRLFSSSLLVAVASCDSLVAIACHDFDINDMLL